MRFANLVWLASTFVSLVVMDSVRGDELSVYILTGQSNSLGTTEMEGSEYSPGSHPADAKTAFFWSNPSAIGSANPNKIVLLGDSGGNIKTLQMQQGRDVNPTFWGPEFGMARRMHELGYSNIMIIKVSRGGGGNGYWQPGKGHMANHLLAQIDVALTAVENRGDAFRVRGFMYLQGESNNQAEAEIADERLVNLVDKVQSNINAKYDNAAKNMYTVIGEVAASQTGGNRILTTRLHKKLASTNQRFGFIGTRDLPLKKDNIHFGKESKLEIGRRFANEFHRQIHLAQ